MTIYGHVLPGAGRIANWANRTNITEKAKQRLKVVDWLRNHNGNVSLASRRFGLNRETVREWRNTFGKTGMLGLNDKSHRPKHVRLPTINWKTVDEIVLLRKAYPAWSKYKIQAILKKKGFSISASSVGRVLKRKKLVDKKISRKRYKASKSPRRRYPKGLRISRAGDMIQIDTKYINIIGGRMIFQFTAIDVLTKIRVLKYYASLSSKNGADFLKHCLNRFPFAIHSIQTDNGKEFLKDFDNLCKELNLTHYFIEPRHPKQNTYVENSHGFDDREFYFQGNTHKNIQAMSKALEQWEYIWNCVRPHQALNYLTPEEYWNMLKENRFELSIRDTIILQT